MEGQAVVGWARDVRDPGRRLEIQLLDGEEVVGFGLADHLRKDLQRQEIGDGKYGFRLRLPAAPADGQSRTLTVCAVTDRGKVPLQRGTVTLAGPSGKEEPAPQRRPERGGTMVGALERLIGRALHGWAFNPDHPDAPALVDLYDDERYLGSVMADRSRPRLYEKGFPSGARGFVFELPADIESGAAERLRARVAGTVYDLRRSKDFAHEPAPVSASPSAAPGATTAPAAPPPPATLREATPRGPVRAADPASPSVALCLIAEEGDVAATVADWAAQLHPVVRLMLRRTDAPLPERLAQGAIPLGNKNAVQQAAREAGFVLFAAAGTRLDPALASAIVALPRFPDVVVVDGERPYLSGEAARMETFLAPARRRMVAVRADLLPGYPGNLRRDLDDGTLSPLSLWLAGRADLIWTALSAPVAPATTEPQSERRARLWRGTLDEASWTVDAGAVLPRRLPDRISIGLWRGWNEAGLPALAGLLAGDDIPRDILVPTEGDGERARARLAEAERAIAASGAKAARARIIDCPPGKTALIRALLAAADGDVVLLSDGSATPVSEDILRMARWALAPSSGAVGLSDDGGSSGATLDDSFTLRRSDGDRMVDGVSFGLMMVATGRLALAGPPADGLDPAHAALPWCRTLARQGLHALVVRATAELAGTPPGFSGGPLPWQVRARLRADGLLAT